MPSLLVYEFTSLLRNIINSLLANFCPNAPPFIIDINCTTGEHCVAFENQDFNFRASVTGLYDFKLLIILV